MEKQLKYGTATLAALIVLLIIYGYFYRISAPQTLLDRPRDQITAHDLIAISNDSEQAFTKQYLYKLLSVKGKVVDVQKHPGGTCTVRLGANPRLPDLYVDCSIDTAYHKDISLQPGDSCTIQGTCAGQLNNVILLECVVAPDGPLLAP